VAVSGPQDGGSAEASSAPDEVDSGGASEINETVLLEPAAAPDPRDHHGVNKRSHQNGKAYVS